MKIIFVNRFFYPDYSATSQMLSDLAFALSESGYTIHVITSRLTYGGEDRLTASEVIKNVVVKRLFSTAFGRANLLGRAIDYITFDLSAALRLAADVKRGDIVVVKTDPPMLSIVAAPIAALKGARHVNWLQDIFPEVATVLGVGSTRTQRWAISFLKWLRNLTFRNARMNVVLGERMEERLRELGVGEEKIRCIPNWANGNQIRPVEHNINRLRLEWGLADTFVAGYSGNLGRAHDFKTVLDAVAHLEAQRTTTAKTQMLVNADGVPPRAGVAAQLPVRWLFIGGGAQLEPLKNAAHERGLASVMFRPYQPRERLGESLSVPDVHLISLKPELEGVIVPSKFYGIAAAGRPVIFVGDPDGELARIIRDNDIGFVVSVGDSLGLAKAILTLAACPEMAAKQGIRSRLLFERKYDFPRAVSAWDALIRDVGL